MPYDDKAAQEKEILVALLPRIDSLHTLQTEGWYHIPVKYAPQKRMPPKVLAFYQGKVFGKENAYKIRYYGEVERVDEVRRKELFPNDEKNQYKAENLYYRLQLKALQERFVPIVSYRPRRILFVPTTHEKFNTAVQINDLFDASPVEDRLWRALKKHHVLAERQWKIVVQQFNYYLDFAVFCNQGKIAVETDGYSFHYDSKNQIDYDTWRQNHIVLDDWHLLRYTTHQINDEDTPYIAQIQQRINRLGGLESPGDFKRKIGEEQGKYIVDGEEPL